MDTVRSSAGRGGPVTGHRSLVTPLVPQVDDRIRAGWDVAGGNQLDIDQDQHGRLQPLADALAQPLAGGRVAGDADDGAVVTLVGGMVDGDLEGAELGEMAERGLHLPG